MKARSRIIKPELYQNQKFAQLSKTARLLFPGLWMIADRDGLLSDNPALIKGMLFPYESINIDKCLAELDESKFIVRYCVQNISYIWIPKFKKHQKIHPKETQSVIELPEKVVLGYAQGEPLADQFRLTSTSTSTSISTSTSTSNVGQKPDDVLSDYEIIISDLNKKSGRNYDYKSAAHQEIIRARIKDGATINQFKQINTNMVAKWGNNPKMSYCIRPSTLYRKSHFDEYLNVEIVDPTIAGMSPVGQKSAINIRNALKKIEENWDDKTRNS